MTRTGRALALVTALGISPAAMAQSSPGCDELVQAASAGAAARIEADDRDIPAPQSLMSLTCLDGFFNGVGLNVLTDVMNPGALLTAAATRALLQACAAARNSWNSALGSVQCGLTVSGFNVGFGSLGGGTFCPRLNFGGGGPSIGSASLSPGANTQSYINGQPMPPIGYPVVRPLGRSAGR